MNKNLNKIMDKKEKLEQAIDQVKQEKESDKMIHSVDSDSNGIMFCGCSKHKSKQPVNIKLEKVVTPIEQKNK